MTEVEMLAGRAWVAMLHDVRPMPADLALDMVQDAAGERAEAAEAIRAACVRHLAGQMPEQPGGAESDELAGGQFMLRHLSAGHTGLAELSRMQLRERASQTRRNHERLPLALQGFLRVDVRLACDWLSWCAHAERCIGLCDRLREAAHPSAGAA